MRTSIAFMFSLAIGVSFLAIPQAHAIGATTFEVPIDGGTVIDGRTDHYRVELVTGWISRSDGLLTTLLSKARGAAFTVDARATFVGNTPPISVEYVSPIEDAQHSMGRPLGLSRQVFPDLPSDISDLQVSAKLATTQTDRVADLLNRIDSNKQNLPAEVFSAPYMGYAQLLSTITQSLFGTDANEYPIHGEFSITAPTTEKYIILVAPTKENDKVFLSLTNAEFRFERPRLQYRNPFTRQWQAVETWNYLVFRVSKNNAVQSVAVRATGSEQSTSWGTVITTQLMSLPIDKANDRSQIASLADNTGTALTNLGKFLAPERSLTNYDRAIALFGFADSSIEALTDACKVKHIAQCPTIQLTQFRKSVAQTHKISETSTRNAATAFKVQAQLVGGIREGRFPRQTPVPGLPVLEQLAATAGPKSTITAFDIAVGNHAAGVVGRLDRETAVNPVGVLQKPGDALRNLFGR